MKIYIGNSLFTNEIPKEQLHMGNIVLFPKEDDIGYVFAMYTRFEEGGIGRDAFIDLETGKPIEINEELHKTYIRLFYAHLFIDRFYKNNPLVQLFSVIPGRVFTRYKEYFLKIKHPKYNALDLNTGFAFTLPKSANCYLPKAFLTTSLED